MKLIVLSSGLFAYYAGQASFVFWSMALIGASVSIRRFSTCGILISLLLVFHIVAKIILFPGNLVEIIYGTRFFWGFFPFYLFFSSEYLRRPVSRVDYEGFFRVVLKITMVLLIAEFISSNALGIQWPNREHNFFAEAEDGIARAYGLGGNASVTSALFIALSGFFFRQIILDMLLLLMTSSGTGVAVLMIKFASMMKNWRALLSGVLIFPTFVGLVLFASNEFGLRAAQKISFDYILHIFSQKIIQIENVSGVIDSAAKVFIGQPVRASSINTGDFQLLDWAVSNGFLGMLLFAILVGSHIRRENFLALFVMIVASAHYQVIFSFPGSILFAWALTYRSKPLGFYRL